MNKIGIGGCLAAVSVAVAILCVGCTAPTTPSTSAVISTSTGAALGAVISVVQGQNFTIQLPSNPSTGYHWNPTYDSVSVALVNRAYLASNIAMPGAPGEDVFTFQGTKQGTSVITFNDISPANQTTHSVSYTVLITS